MKLELVKALGLTRIQEAILWDRLVCFDCLEEVFTDPENDVVYSAEEVGEVVDLLLAHKLSEAVHVNERLTKDILCECVEGSTYFASAYDEFTVQRFAAHVRQGQALAEIIGTYCGREIEIPLD